MCLVEVASLLYQLDEALLCVQYSTEIPKITCQNYKNIITGSQVFILQYFINAHYCKLFNLATIKFSIYKQAEAIKFLYINTSYKCPVCQFSGSILN